MKAGLIVLLVLSSLQIQAQTKISGLVKDAKGKAVVAASVTLKGTYDGTVADSSGHFLFDTYEQGSFVLEVRSIGYKTAESNLILKNGEKLTVNIVLKEDISELKAVTVTAGSFAAGDKKEQPLYLPLQICIPLPDQMQISLQRLRHCRVLSK